ncbi:MAG: ACP S-malonyltransferase [Phycisphaerae bacterium]|jgi:[acyl-carrier-protein] S-malonyltransferase
MKSAFLFPGQGAQHIGMGKDIAQEFSEAAAIFQKANSIVGYDLQTVCFDGPDEKLNSTAISQPAIFTVTAAILEVMKSRPVTVDMVPAAMAGLSMGEYSALYAAGLVSFEDDLLLVKRRGEAMQAASDMSHGGMVCLIGLENGQVKELCREAGAGELLVGVNYNCPGQIVVSGTKAACARAEQLAEKYGAVKAVPLSVAGAFHTEMMNSAKEQLGYALKNAQIAEPRDINVIANINAEYYRSSADIIEGLQKQLTQPILWQKCMERLMADGVEEFYEIGPGKVLTGLMKRINRKQKVVNISDAASLKKLLGE